MFLKCIYISLLLVVMMMLLFMLISYMKLLDMETFSTYECGFMMMSNVRMFFSFRFFLICILFLIFDVEIVLMLPIPYLVFGDSQFFLSLFFFFTVLVLGLLYEYFYGSLNWLNFISKA